LLAVTGVVFAGSLAALDQARQTPGMGIELRVERTINAPPATVFALALDAARFPATFRGCGPIPALRRITANIPSAVGSTRTVESSDGSIMTERITAFDAPHRHAYTLSGLRPPLAWLARGGDAEWTFASAGDGTRVSWRYAFTLTSAVAWPIAAPLLHIFMRGAMRRCLAAMARDLEKVD
jgi:uncharacterized protein YndB with AHSA1/START domain